MSDKGRLKVGIYNPYLDTFGGGEKDICVMAEALSQKYQVEILSFKDVPKSQLESRLGVRLDDVDIKVVLPYSGYKLHTRVLRFLANRLYFWQLTRPYDLFINLVNYAPFFCFAKKGVLRIQFPFDRPALILNAIKTYDHYLVNSEYTRRWTKERWGVDAQIIYPPVEMFTPGVKENIVLSVGRFFAGGHNKKHHVMISAFKSLCDAGLAGWEYHIIGATLKGREHEEYTQSVKDAAKGYPIFIHTDTPFSFLREYYAKSKIFLHATGYGEDENIFPERFEHFGITTVEAMSAGCVPVVINKGGQTEIVSHRENGFLFNTERELVSFSRQLMEDDQLSMRMSKKAIDSSTRFGLERFKKEVLEMADKATEGLSP